MARTVGIGHQDYETVRMKNTFYIDKTSLIREWWENEDAVTLIARPRRFGKTLNMSMLEKFFSVEYAGRSELFEGLDVWKDEKYRELQGKYPVIFISFASVKENTFEQARESIYRILIDVYNKNQFLLKSGLLEEEEKRYFMNISTDMSETDATISLHKMSDFLSRYYKQKVIILLDEYDTPMQEAYVNGYWDKIVSFIRVLFNSTFKTNPYLERAIMTGITRVSKESIFSDLNNLEVVTTTSEKYADKFGFTEAEVVQALDEYGLDERKAEVKQWYDGFTFGNKKDIYNPWSIINYLDKKKVAPYWANTSSNSLAGTVIREGNVQTKEAFETLLRGDSIITELDEDAIWALLVASGYLKVKRHWIDASQFGSWKQLYELELTNFEIRVTFANIVRGWFAQASGDYNAFIKALLNDDTEAMNAYMNRVSQRIFSTFDVGKKPSEQSEPERFYHGFVLGLMVELIDQYEVKSNRESGFGRYDVVLKPRDIRKKAMILEFKVFNPNKETVLEDTVKNALKQIKEKNYAAELLEAGIVKENIKMYGFAFKGKKILICGE